MSTQAVTTGSQSPRERILDASGQLFARQGFHATGVSQIAGDAGVSKKTLYHHFRSKDDLVHAVLSNEAIHQFNVFTSVVERDTTDPECQLFTVFDFAEGWFRDSEFNGCMFVGAATEFDSSHKAILRQCAEYKRRVREYFEDLCARLGLEQPGFAARQLALIFEGAIAVAHVLPDDESPKSARALAELVVQNHRAG